MAETATDSDTLEREMTALKNTGDVYNKTLLTLDFMETNDGGILRKNIVNFLTS